MRSFGYERSLALALLCLAAHCKKTHPVVLFHSDAHAPPARVDAALDGAAADVPRFEAVPGAAVDGDGSALTVDGATLASAAGTRFTHWLRVDLDGDGQPTDVVAARLGADARALAPAVFRRLGNVFEPVPLPNAEPSEARCAETSLRLTSPRSVTVAWRCAQPVEGASIAEEQMLLGLSSTPGVRERATLLAGALPDTALALHLEGVDLDGDGRDEIVAGLSAGPPGVAPQASARVAFFERAGALARDTSEPAASLQANVSNARRALASGRAGAVAALATLDDYLRLRRAFCAEGGLARVRLRGATGFECSGAPTGPAAELYARTLVNLGETPAAEAQIAAETATDFGVVTSERVLADIDRAALADRAVTARPGPFAGGALDAIAPARSGVLTFNRPTAPVTTVTLHGPAAGAVDVATLTFTPGAPGAATDVLPRSPDGASRVTGFVEACTGVAVVTCPASDEACLDAVITERTRALPAGATAHALPTLPSFAFAQRCARDPAAIGGVPPSRARALGYGRDALVVAVHGLLYKVLPNGPAVRVALNEPLGGGFPAGAAVSESGAVAAVPGRSGAWVRERNAWRRWAPAGLAGRFSQMSDLTVTNDARALAAMVGTQLWLLERPRAPRR